MTVTIDLHLHTTASDGRCTPQELATRAFAAGIRVMSVTDHDTRAGEPAARATAEALGMTFISGIEITSVHAGKDVHVLAYGLPATVPALDAVLTSQRQSRVERAREIGERLARLNVPIDVDALVASAASASGKAIARPQIAERLVAAGHVSSVAEAFDRYLDERSPAYVPHRGASPAEIVSLVTTCGGVASVAHPGQLKKDELIGELVDAGLPCLEAYHSSHDMEAQRHYLDLAGRFRLAVTGGSDFHGDGTRRAEFFGVVGLPPAEFERFKAVLAQATASQGA
ncbi:MAG TPA: PHP domain-containing protein [Vicinamibacterales bacterium]|nr:PHP domain-containing protein [Vicinamibacterales bacterium]